MMKIPFNKIPLSGNELNNIRHAMESGYLQGGGAFMKACEEKYRKQHLPEPLFNHILHHPPKTSQQFFAI
ncbi:MAG: hypothetical protein ACLUKN_05075 [Bacilli bacterium]